MLPSELCIQRDAFPRPVAEICRFLRAEFYLPLINKTKANSSIDFIELFAAAINHAMLYGVPSLLQKKNELKTSPVVFTIH